jgi:uncharacterized membrane protein
MRYNSAIGRTKGVDVTADAPSTNAIYRTRLTPHRSMTPGAANRVILLVGAGTVALSLPFYVMGAWPVVGFMGLDVLALYIAFRVSFYSARAFETLDLTPFELRFTKTAASGERAEWRFDTCWVRLEQEVHEEFGTQRVTLVARGERVEIGAFLGADQKAELAADLTKALAIAKRGPMFG